jgi:hypothetical protein
VATKNVVTRDYLLEEIAIEQWQADVPGGEVAQRQRRVTDRKLAQIGLTRDDPRYKSAYERVRKSVT